MITLEDLLKLNDAEKEFRELFIRYPQIHQNPPKTVGQMLEITLPELAKKFSYSERQVSRLLVKYTGKSFTTILQDTRMQKACQLLKESNRTINEIIFQCGYKNQNHFYTIFKRYYGKTPDQYRRDIIFEKSLKDDGMDFDELM